MTRLSKSLALIASLALSCSAGSQAYPQHPITLIVPFSAGGDADIAARNLAPVAQRVLGQAIVPMNRAGASGAIGSQVVLPALQQGLTYKSNDFSFIGLLELNPLVCAVRGESSYRTLADLVEALRSKPGKLNTSTSGAATILNFGPQLLLDVLKLGKEAAVQIAYKGGSEPRVLSPAETERSAGEQFSVYERLGRQLQIEIK